MENQHRKIRGYRELSQDEIDLMNRITALGPQIEQVLFEVNQHLNNATVEDKERHVDTTPHRFLEQAKMQFQTAQMLLTRAVAQPTFF